MSGEIRSSSGMTTQLTLERETYLPGEPVGVTLCLRNGGMTSIPFNGMLDVRFGGILPQISAERDGNYEFCMGPEFGTTHAVIRSGLMRPGERVTTSFRILYNHVMSSMKIQRSYAFPRAGTYFLRVRLHNIVPSQDIHTAPVRVRITEPEGTDVAVWNLLQTRDAAYFLYRGWPVSTDEGIAEEFERIIARYPDSTYTPYMRESLDKFRSRKRSRSSVSVRAEIADVGGQTFMVRAVPGGGGRSGKSHTQKDIEEIVRLTGVRVQAYNADDPPRLIQHISYRDGHFRRSWERSSERRRRRITRTFREAFYRKGPASVKIARVTFREGGEAEADLIVSYERAPEENPFVKTKYVLDDDGVWRIGSLELEW